MRQPAHKKAEAAPTGRHKRSPLADDGHRHRERGRSRKALMVSIFAAAVLIIIAAAVLISDPKHRSYKNYISQATASYQAGNYDGALSYLRRAEGIDHSDECLALMADCYEAQGNLELALEILRQLDTSDSAISQRILSIERRRLQLENAGKVTVAGQQLSPDTSSVALDGLEITDAMLDTINQLTSLGSLSLKGNQLSDVSALAELGGLVTLDLSDNSIEDVSPLAGLNNLHALFLDNNPVQDLSPLCSLDGLAILSITGLELSKEELAELSQAMPNCAIYTDAAVETLVNITIGGVTFKSDTRELDLSGLGIRDIDALARCTELRRLDLSGNEIMDLSPIMNLPYLERLDISDNRISDLRPLMGVHSLQRLKAAGNRLTGTAAAGEIEGLVELDLSDNQITDFTGLIKMSNLRRLSLKNTGLDDGQLQVLEQLSGVTLMELEENPGLSGEAVDELKRILYRCDISHSTLVYSVEVWDRSIRCDTSELQMASLGMKDLSWLTNLYCLETLDLSDNEISNIYILQYTRSRFTLKSLDLSDNAIQDITALINLTSLETLDLSGNVVNSLAPIMGLTSLRTVDLRGNPLTMEQVDKLRAALPDCEVLFD